MSTKFWDRVNRAYAYRQEIARQQEILAIKAEAKWQERRHEHTEFWKEIDRYDESCLND